MPSLAASEIADYALIGDWQTAALVDRGGSIDWLCWPRFDSDACFAALLGDRSNGCWRIAPTAAYETSRRYRPDTLILETVFETAAGSVALIDFMPVGAGDSKIIRILEGRGGTVAMRMDLVLRFGYGRTAPWVTELADGRLGAIAGPSMAILQSPVETRGEDLATIGEFEVGDGQSLAFVLSHQPSFLPPSAATDPAAALRATEQVWRGWSAKCQVKGPYAEAARRSLITLKALTFAATGGVVAAPTTSLPEKFGGERNWDYRYCWIRDSTLTLLALMNAGYFEEAGAWRDWLHRAVAGDPADMQIMYGLGGERRLSEWIADWLPGHHASAPVRIGNAAHMQFQLDVYGELMDTFHQAAVGGLATTRELWDVQLALIEHVAKVWREPDEGIWEVRGPRRAFTYSRVMAWVAVDRAIASAEIYGLEAPLEQWRALRADIHADVWANGFDRARNTFVQAYGEAPLDASLLRLALVGFIDPLDPAYVGTVEAIERELLVGGFLQRYRTEKSDDGLPPGEGTFLACSFWLADAYAAIGRTDDAHRLFARLLDLQNDLGLLAEEYDSAGKRFAGNFPQAFSHVGLISTAINLGPPARR
jgi:GH15 family glucan-1,4-alpha-glucosidase